MSRRFVLRLLLAGFALLAAFGSGAAGAADACVGYAVGTPVVSPGNQVCQPTPLPNQFSNQQCGGVPPASVSYCAWVKIPRP